MNREKKRRDFTYWCKENTPHFTWDWPHLLLIDSYLHKVTAGDIDKIMFFTPPRHGKSEKVTVRYPAWRLERDPTLRVIVGAYSQTLANKFSRKTRKIVAQNMPLSDSRTAVDDWETYVDPSSPHDPGGLRAVGVGGGITGQGGNLIVVDDPVKSREEANSEVYREKVYDWYTDDLYTRLEPGGAIIIIMTRWHEDDLAGRILTSEDGSNWTVVRLPALAESQFDRDVYFEKVNREAGQGDLLSRKVGQALCPQRFDEDKLYEIKTVLGPIGFEALYQQNPTLAEGEIFKVGMLEIVPDIPANCKIVRYWDKAGTKDGGAYTCGTKIAIAPDRTVYVCDVVRGQWGSGERENIIKQTAEIDGRGVVVYVEQEPGSGGKESAENTVKNLMGFAAYADKVTGGKETRAEPFAAQVEIGNVRLVKGAWNKPYIEELRSFPNGKYKDQADSSSGGFNKLNEYAAGGYGVGVGKSR